MGSSLVGGGGGLGLSGRPQARLTQLSAPKLAWARTTQAGCAQTELARIWGSGLPPLLVLQKVLEPLEDTRYLRVFLSLRCSKYMVLGIQQY